VSLPSGGTMEVTIPRGSTVSFCIPPDGTDLPVDVRYGDRSCTVLIGELQKCGALSGTTFASGPGRGEGKL
jgi:hypothetical protein